MSSLKDVSLKDVGLKDVSLKDVVVPKTLPKTMPKTFQQHNNVKFYTINCLPKRNILT